MKPVRRTHFAALEAKDIPVFLRALDQNDACLQLSTRHAVRLMLLTFVRTSELIKAEWKAADLENKEWIIPAERMKMRVAHIVPLCRQAAEIFKLKRNWRETAHMCSPLGRIPPVIFLVLSTYGGCIQVWEVTNFHVTREAVLGVGLLAIFISRGVLCIIGLVTGIFSD